MSHIGDLLKAVNTGQLHLEEVDVPSIPSAGANVYLYLKGYWPITPHY